MADMLQYLQTFFMSADYLQNADNRHICSADLAKNLYRLLSKDNYHEANWSVGCYLKSRYASFEINRDVIDLKFVWHHPRGLQEMNILFVIARTFHAA